MTLPIFHLAFPVNSLAEAEQFYVDLMGGSIGRRRETWMDVFFFGHQLTVHERPEEVLSREQLGVRHFGIVLPWQEWEALAESLESKGATMLSEPKLSFVGTPREQGKMLLLDPGLNTIEIKTYKDPDTAMAKG